MRYISILFFLLSTTVFSQNINISLFSEYEISRMGFAVTEGKYELVANDEVVYQLTVNKGLNIRAKRKRIKVRTLAGKRVGRFTSFYIRGVADTNSFRIKPVEPDVKEREYYDDIRIKFDNRLLKTVNDVDFEHYIAGVVESEGGAWAHIEYYKSQAVLCRTYAMKNHKRHLSDGYNLCDDVHCQAYKHKCIYNKDIEKACEDTKGLVVVDKRGTLISATFYSNSGGQTANSEDVWGYEFPYLRSINDPYSLGQRNAEWEKRISKSSWISYLQANGANIDFTGLGLSFDQPTRSKAYQIDGFEMPLKQIRTDWKLRSTFFSVYEEGADVVFKGRGYGHGVGLAQEGAMKMADEGKLYDEIIKFYYNGVKLSGSDKFEFFKVE